MVAHVTIPQIRGAYHHLGRQEVGPVGGFFKENALSRRFRALPVRVLICHIQIKGILKLFPFSLRVTISTGLWPVCVTRECTFACSAAF